MLQALTASLAAVLAALGVFYTLALHAVRFPMFRGDHVLAEAVGTGTRSTLTIFTGVNVPNLLTALGLAALAGVAAAAFVAALAHHLGAGTALPPPQARPDDMSPLLSE